MIHKRLHGAFLFPILKGALHYPFNWIRFLEINKLCNLMAKNLTFSTNRKLFSISWKWKWMNRIRHRRENVVRKQKFELIWKIIYLYKSMSGKNPPEKSPPWRVRGRGRVRLGTGLGLESRELFSGGDFFLEPYKSNQFACY